MMRVAGWRIAAACALVAFLLLWKGTLAGEVFAPVRLLSTFSPWQHESSSPEPLAWDVLLWDGAAQFYVWRDVVNRAWRSGEIPLWNPYTLCGTPLAANSQSAPFYPPHLLTFWIPTPNLMGWLAWFHVVWAGLGIGLWLLRIGLDWRACVLASGVWSLSAFFTCWLQLTSVPATLSWFGWVLLGAHLTFTNGLRSVWAFSLAAGMMVLAGHLQFAFYGLILAFAYIAFLSARQIGIGGQGTAAGIGTCLMAFMLAFLISQIQVLPTLELSGMSHRVSTPTEAGYAAYLRNALPPLHLLTLFSPDAFGNPRQGHYWGAVHYAELALFVGVGALFFAFLAFGRERRSDAWFWLSVWIAGMLLALGTPLNRLLYFYLPGFSGTGSPARVLCVCAFALAVLTAFGFDRWLKQPASIKLQRPFAGVLSAGGLLVLMGFWLLPQNIPASQLQAGLISSLPRLIATLAGVGLLCWLVPRQKQASSGLLTAIMLALCLAEPLSQAASYNPTASPQEAYPANAQINLSLPAGERVAALNTRWSLFETPPATLPPNSAAMYGLHDTAGYDSLAPRHIKRFLDWLNGQDSAPPENGNMFFIKTADSRLQWLRVNRILTPEGWQHLPDIEGKPVYLGSAEVVRDEEQVWKRLEEAWRSGRVLLHGRGAEEALKEYGSAASSSAGATAEIIEYRASYVRLKVVNPSNGTLWLLLSDTWYPGWQASVSSKPVPVVLANGAFRAVPISPGMHEVVMWFAPVTFKMGLFGTIAGLIMAVVVSLGAARFYRG
jgi:hypothetical protein